MKYASLMEHAGLRCLEPYFRSYAVKGLKAVSAGRVSAKATAVEYFAQAVYGRVGELDNTLAALRLVVRFLNDLRQLPDPDPEIYRYHYENFIFRGIGAVDRAFLLVADALLLSKRARKTNQLIAEQVQNHTGVHEALLRVKGVMEAYRKSRNIMIHDSAYSSRELGTLSGIRHLGIELVDTEAALINRAVFGAGSDTVIQAIAELEVTLHALMCALQPIFEFVVKRANGAAAKC
ncbi:hypothetical protein [Pseudomonas sp. NPDC089401]|uniref:hypothetical protein n=1 Tax=Pseudomonas sp. NPDC089401 TaxID=3364462 RepID=UPI00380BF52A